MTGYEIYRVFGGDKTELIGTYGSDGVAKFKELAKADEMSEYALLMLVSVFSNDDDYDWHVKAVAYEGKITWLADGKQEEPQS